MGPCHGVMAQQVFDHTSFLWFVFRNDQSEKQFFRLLDGQLPPIFLIQESLRRYGFQPGVDNHAQTHERKCAP